MFSILSFNILLGDVCAPETNWCFDQSTWQAFYFFYDIEIDGSDIEPGSVVGSGEGVWECPDSDCDIIGAFIDDECVGWTYPFFGGGYTVPVMGDDGSFPGYASPGDIPEFKLFDNSSGQVYPGVSETEIEGWAINEFFLIELMTNGLLSTENVLIPDNFEISSVYPNPFNPSTTIQYSVPTYSNVKIGVVNLLGQEVALLRNTYQQAGYHTVTWDAGKISSGMYLIQLQSADAVVTRKVVLVK